jgi:MFS family permease
VKSLWFASLLVGPVVGLLVGSAMMVDWTDASWQWRSVAWILLGLVVPVVFALLHTRSVGVLVVSLLAGLTTFPAWRRLIVGPRVTATTITAIDCQIHERHGMGCIEDRLTLGDGRSVLVETARLGRLRVGQPAQVTTLDDTVLSVQ